ncbi:MAG: hypothetical protein ACOVOI_07015, partial [Hyphomicrobiales bacterium]
ALAMEPKILLLDEPFGALDALTRAHLQDSVMQIHATLKNTMIMITHDVDEAVLLSDRIIMMTNGPSATIGEILDVTLPPGPSRSSSSATAWPRRASSRSWVATRSGATRCWWWGPSRTLPIIACCSPPCSPAR